MKVENRRKIDVGPQGRGWLAKNQKAIIAILVAVLPYVGYNGYKDVKQALAPPQSNTVTVNVESVPEAMSSHVHAPVVARSEIQAMIEKSINDHFEKARELFREKESWEK